MSVYAALLVVLLACAAASVAQARSGEVRLWPTYSLTKVFRTEIPRYPGGVAQVSGAADEVASGQVVLRSETPLRGVRARTTDLRMGDAVIPASAVTLQWVRYIDIKRNSQGVPPEELVAAAPASIPDPFWDRPAIDVPAATSQPLWIEVTVPDGAGPGEYAGTITVEWAGGSSQIPLDVNVYGFQLPKQRHQMVTNWFTFPGAGYHVADGSPQYWDLAAKFARFMVEHRQTCFKADLSLIKTTYEKGRGFRCDFTRLDKWADVFFGAGMQRMELFQAGTISASVVDPAAVVSPADLVVEVKTPGLKLTPEQKLRGLLGQLEKHIRARKWAGKVMLHIQDEPFPACVPSYRKVAKTVHEAAPSVKVIEAVEATGFGDAIDVLVPKLSHLNLFHPYFERAHADGKELWFYTCCHPWGRYPNRFLDQPLVKARVLHWISYLYGLDGYLHWGLNYFADKVEPYSEEGISEGLPLGDRAIMYPGANGPVGSLRASAMRDGLQDYEYLWTLEDRLRALKERVGSDAEWLDPRQRPLELCRRVAQSFYRYARDASVLLRTRDDLAHEIELIGMEPLLYVQTEPAEGAEVPAGPRMIIVHGIASPGATVTINGEKVINVRPSGAFTAHCFPSSQTVTVRAEKDGQAREVQRTFFFVE